MSKDLETSWRNAFDFVQKFHMEISYLIKEVEGQLEKERESFVLCRPVGYAVTSRTSAGLDSRKVRYWIPATFTVAFVREEDCAEFVREEDSTKFVREEDSIKVAKSYTETPFKDSLRVLFLHVKAYESEMERPIIFSGVLERVRSKKKDLTKFERLMYVFSYRPDAVFAKLPVIDYQDGSCSLAGRAITTPLFSITSAKDVKDKLIDRMLKLYRKQRRAPAPALPKLTGRQSSQGGWKGALSPSRRSHCAPASLRICATSLSETSCFSPFPLCSASRRRSRLAGPLAAG